MPINITDELHAATTKGKIASAKEVFLTGDKENLQQIGEKTHQLEDSIKNIAATGGASTAAAVTFDNVASGMTAVNAQGAIEELNTKNNAQDTEIAKKANSADINSKMNEESTRVDAEIAKKVDKTSIVQEFGDSEDKVVSQFALPFREIESPEFIHCIVDSDNHLLFGIQLDGSIEWGKGIPTPIKDKFQEVINQSQQDKTDLSETINTLNGILDKTTIKDDEGTVVETPFHYIQSEEFIFAKVDADNKLLFGIQWDGTPVFGKTSVVEDRLQAQVNILSDRIAAILGDGDTTSAIDTLKELKSFFANIDNTQTLTSILATIDKIAVKNEAGEIQDSPFRVIENDEFLCAMVDAEDRILFGISKETGKPYYPLNDMYHVVQNEEFFAVWLDTDNHILLGIRRNGQIIGEIHAVNALKEIVTQLQSDVASLQSLQEKVADIDTSLKELLNVFSLKENPEFLSVETDADGKILASTNVDGSHYAHNLKSETIDAKVDKEEGESLIDSVVAESQSSIEDPEGRMEITTDSDERVMSYRDSNGKKHEHNMNITNLEVSNLNLQGNSVNDIQDALKANGFNVKTPIDWSDSQKVELPMPVSCAIINLTTDKQAESKGSNIPCFMEFWDCNGNYFKKPIILNAQGSSSMGYSIKNQAIDINDGSKIKFGNWCYMDSFHIKKYYIDVFRGQCVAQYWLTEQAYMTRPFGQRRPYDYLNHISVVNNGNGAFDKDFWSGALCHPDGFPCHLFFNGKDVGVYAFNLKKDRANYNCKKDNAKNIILDGILGSVFWTANGDLNKKGDSSTTVWQDFEVRNPKIKKDINGNDYDGDAPTEPSTDYSETKGYIEELTKIIPSIKAAGTDEEKKTIFESAFNLPFLIDYDILSQVDYNYDGYRKNWIWCCWDGKLWTPTRYDLDSVFGQHWNGASYVEGSITNILGDSDNLPTYYLHNLYKSEESARYAELRNKGILTIENIVGNLEKWVNMCGYDNLKNDIEKIVVDTAKGADDTEERTVPCTPSYRDGSLIYSKSPTIGGWYNSLERVRNWVEKRLETLDTYFNYNK